MPTKGTVARGIRISEDLKEWIEQRAAKKGWSFNKWVIWAIRERMRSHVKKA